MPFRAHEIMDIGGTYCGMNAISHNLIIADRKQLINGNGFKVIYHYHIWKVLVEDAYNKQFLCKLLEYATQSLMGDTHGIAMMHLTKSGMEKTEFIVPPKGLQEQFAAFVRQTDKSKLYDEMEVAA